MAPTPPPGTDPNLPTYVAIKGRVFDVSGNAAYALKGQYHGMRRPFFLGPVLEKRTQQTWREQRTLHSCPCERKEKKIKRRTSLTPRPRLVFEIVFAGKDASRALATSSLKPEDCRAEWSDLGEKEKTVLNEWYTFFSKRYNIVGTVQGAGNL